MAHTRGLYSRHNRAGQERWYVRAGFHGRMQHFGSFATKTEAKQFYQRTKLAQLEQRLHPEKSVAIDYTVPELFAAYLPMAQHRRAFREQQRFAAWWSAYWPHRPVRSLTAPDLEHARVVLRTSGRLSRRTEGTVTHYLKCLKRAMRAVIQPRSWVVDLWSAIRFERPDGSPPTPLDPNDEHSLLQRMTQDDAEKVRLAIVTGLRRAPLFGLRWERVLWDQRGIGLPTMKRQRERFLPLPKDALTILRRRWQRLGKPQTGWVFPHQTHPNLPEDPGAWYKYRFKPAVKRAGLDGKGIKFHSTRHTWAVRFLEGGGNVRALQKAGGWSSLSQVEIYTQLRDESLRQAMNAGAKVGSNSGKLWKSTRRR